MPSPESHSATLDYERWSTKLYAAYAIIMLESSWAATAPR